MKKSSQRSKRLFFTVVAFMTLCMGSVFAQISGTITDAITGEPLIGATVQIKGSTAGTIADFDGNYTLDATQGDVLMFSYVGYLSQEVTVGAQSSINMQLKEDVQELEKIVIVGYSSKKKSDLTGAVSSVSSKELTKIPSSSIANALQGRAAGVSITSQSGSPGAASSIRIRGTGSINDSEPLYVVDGIPLTDAPDIRPEDIESIEVLKDASASAIYGNRGANGVIIITTKRGSSSKKPTVNFSYYTGWKTIPSKFDVLNADEYLDYMSNLYDSASYSAISAFSDTTRAANGYPDSDWQDLITRTGRVNNYSLSVAGGGENSNFSIGANYYNEDGILIGTNIERFSFRANSDFKISNKIRIGESLNISHSSRRKVTGGGSNFGVAPKVSPLMPVYDSVNEGGFAGPHSLYTGSNDKTNPLAEMTLNEDYEIRTRIIGNMYFNYEIIKGLSYEFRIGGDFEARNDNDWSPSYVLGRYGQGSSRDNTEATLVRDGGDEYAWNVNNLFRYNKEIGKHSINLLLGHEASKKVENTFSATGQGFTDNDVNAMAQAGTPLSVSGELNIGTLLSYFSRLDYVFDGKYLITGTVRRDGSSRFITDEQWGVFPSFSLGWKFSKEAFMQNVSFISQGKLRYGWGKTGNQKGIDYYDYLDYLDPPSRSRYAFGTPTSTQYLGLMPLESFANNILTWEATVSSTFGLDLSFFNNKILLTTDYYIRKTEDMIVLVPVSMMTGKLESNPPPQNIGEVYNNGYEVSITYRKYEGTFNYSASFNASGNKNSITSDVEYIDGDHSRNQEGKSIGSIYGYVTDGIFQSQEEIDIHAEQSGAEPGDIRYVDINGDGIISDQDRTFIGKSLPDLTLGLSLECSYKNFDLSAFIQGVYGFQIYNELRQAIVLPNETQSGQGVEENKLQEAMNYWTVDNTNTDIPRITKGDPNDQSRISDYPLWLEDGSFTRLKDVQLGFTFPKALVNKINISNLRIYASVQNLYTFTKYKGYDPEMSSTKPIDAKVDNGTYPLAKTYIAGVQLTF